MSLRQSVFLMHALERIDLINEYTEGRREAFFEDRKTRDAVLRNLELIGQSLKDHGLETLEASQPDIRWRRIGNFRNVLAHEYMALDLDLIWEIITVHLPVLREAIASQLTIEAQ